MWNVSSNPSQENLNFCTFLLFSTSSLHLLSSSSLYVPVFFLPLSLPTVLTFSPPPSLPDTRPPVEKQKVTERRAIKWTHSGGASAASWREHTFNKTRRPSHRNLSSLPGVWRLTLTGEQRVQTGGCFWRKRMLAGVLWTCCKKTHTCLHNRIPPEHIRKTGAYQKNKVNYVLFQKRRVTFSWDE